MNANVLVAQDNTVLPCSQYSSLSVDESLLCSMQSFKTLGSFHLVAPLLPRALHYSTGDIII